MNLLVTGKPGVGKTTVIQKVLAGLGREAGGFTTREIRRGGTRVGFSIRAVDTGQEGVLAHIDISGPHRVGRYAVNVRDMERVGVSALVRATRSGSLIVMDEIGRMENFCASFQKAVLQALDAPQDVLGTLQMRSTPFLNGIRERPDVTIKLVSHQNRDGLAERLIALLGSVSS